MNQLPGEKLRDEGIDRAVKHAERVEPDWALNALDYVRANAFGEFTAEDIRLEAEANGIPNPPHERAWGGVFVKARTEGFIKPTGHFRPAKHQKSHRGPKRVWVRVAA